MLCLGRSLLQIPAGGNWNALDFHIVAAFQPIVIEEISRFHLHHIGAGGGIGTHRCGIGVHDKLGLITIGG